MKKWTVFFGFAHRGPIFAAGSEQQVSSGSSGRNIAIVALIIGIVAGAIAGAALGVTISNYYSNGQLNTNYSNLNAKVSSIGSQLAFVNQTPSVRPIKMQWCTQNVLQDRFCPGNIIVDQGDIVQVLFLQNDTAAHTFTILPTSSGGYDFQVNDSGAGELDFLHDYAPIPAGCSNSGTFAQMSAGVSGVYCVSGTSLLSNSTLQAHGATNFEEAQNPYPGLPFTPNPGQIVAGEPPGVNLTNPGVALFPVNDQANMLSLSVSGVGVNATGGSETQGIGAFWATTPGVYEFFCHYHVANGMFGYLIVLPNLYCNKSPTSCGLPSS
jgi:plastocyanin